MTTTEHRSALDRAQDRLDEVEHATPYPVDSATRTCCGGIGDHTVECKPEPVNLDPPDPALARWQQLAARDHEVYHDGDAEKILMPHHPRPAWADPDEDETGRSHLSSGYGSEAVRVRASHAFGVDHGNQWQPACAYVSAKFWGNSHTSIQVTLSQVKDEHGKPKWQNVGMSFQPHEALELADVLRAAVDLIGGEK